jgi:uncharacterized membrane protein YfcA
VIGAMDLSLPALALVAAASLTAGIVNAVAGGGTLIAFPALTLAGLPAVDASVTLTTALTPGYLGGTLAQRQDLEGQAGRLRFLAPAGAAGGLTGAALLARTDEELFRLVIPWLIFAACGLLAAQTRIRALITARRRTRPTRHTGGPRQPAAGAGLFATTYVSGIYGGYFGGALGIILLAALGVTIDDDLRRLNALKQALSFAVNGAAAVLLALSGRVPWAVAAVVAAGSLAGGALGGRVASRLDPELLRRVVIVLGVIAGVVYLVRS